MADTKLCIKCSLYLDTMLFEKCRNVCCNCRLKQIQEKRNARKVYNVTIESKVCGTCKLNKTTSEFSKLSNSPDGLNKCCKECYKHVRRPNRKIVTSSEDKLLKCNRCNLDKSSQLFRTNKRSTTGYFKTCMECWKPSEITTERRREYEKRYASKHPEKIKEKNRKQGQKLQRKIKDRLRSRITSALSCINYKKIDKTINYLGCSLDYLKKWFEYQFSDEISWNNYAEWHIDHVNPCESFDLTKPEEQAKCFNWSNLRPCLIKENLTKGAKVIQSLIDSQQKKALEFMKINPLPSQSGNRIDGTL